VQDADEFARCQVRRVWCVLGLRYSQSYQLLRHLHRLGRLFLSPSVWQAVEQLNTGSVWMTDLLDAASVLVAHKRRSRADYSRCQARALRWRSPRLLLEASGPVVSGSQILTD
jgi:putative copper export protein